VFYELAHHENRVSDGWSWVASGLVIMGKYDRRYVESDGFLVSSDVMLALLGGPLLLLFAWASFVRASWRHGVGVAGACLELYLQILYYAIEIHYNFKHVSVSSPALFVIMFLLFGLLRIILPLLVIIREIIGDSNRISMLDIQRKRDKRINKTENGKNENESERKYNVERTTERCNNFTPSITRRVKMKNEREREI